MAIDPNKLSAFASGNKLPRPGGGAPGEGDDLDAAPESGAPEEGAEGGEDDARFGNLIPMLTEFGSDIQEALDDLDPEYLTDLDLESPADDQILAAGLQHLDRRLQKELTRALAGGITEEQANLLGSFMEMDGQVADGLLAAGWLTRIANKGGKMPAAPVEDDMEELPSDDAGLDEEEGIY